MGEGYGFGCGRPPVSQARGGDIIGLRCQWFAVMVPPGEKGCENAPLLPKLVGRGLVGIRRMESVPCNVQKRGVGNEAGKASYFEGKESPALVTRAIEGT